MKKHNLYYILFALIIAVGCSNTSGEKPATVSIDLGLYGKSISKADGALAGTSTVPTNIRSIDLTVTSADGTEVDTRSILPSEGTTTIELPAGDYTFAVTATTSGGTITAYGGEANAILKAGESTSVAINMAITETKILIPDKTSSYTSTTGRVVQIDDMSGKGWTVLTGTSLGFAESVFYPSDIDIDFLGRIYILNSYAGIPDIIRVDDITSTTYSIINSLESTTLTSIAVDRVNNYVYYSVSSQIYRSTLDGVYDELFFADIPLVNTRGLAIDNAGYIYASGTYNSSNGAIVKIDPSTGTETTRYDFSSSTLYPKDIMIKSNTLYAIFVYSGSTETAKIMQFDLDLNFIGENGKQAGTVSLDATQGNLYNPKLFVGILNRKIYFIDEASNNDLPMYNYTGDRIVAIDDIAFNGWETFGSSGTGANQFTFYWGC